MDAKSSSPGSFRSLWLAAGATTLACALTAVAVWAAMRAEPQSAAPKPIAATEAPQPQAAASKAPVECRNCGRIEFVHYQETRAQPTGTDAIGGAVAGGALLNQFGKGHGKQALTLAGAAGGAVLGHQAEQRMAVERVWTVTVRMDNGARQHIAQNWPPNWTTGDRVRVVNGQIVSR